MASTQDTLLIVHGGGPTAVINASLYGAVCEALASPGVGRVLGARRGVAGILSGDFVDFSQVASCDLSLLPSSPSSAIGTGRDAIDDAGYAQLAQALHEQGVRWLLMTGGNGTMDTCGKICAACKAANVPINVVGIPKTMDNDLAAGDHAPGFGSAARFAAATTAEVCCDVRGLPIHLVILEFMGRSAGWVTASSALAQDAGLGGPDLIYLPERPFDEQRFLNDAQQLIDTKHAGVIAVSEGLTNAAGEPIVDPVLQVGRATYFGDVSAHLATLVLKELRYKARSEKPGLVGRASIEYQSSTDRQEAEMVGREAVRAALAGASEVMVGIERINGPHYASKPYLIPIQKVMLEERHVPDAFINAAGNGVTPAFCDWCRPLIGATLPQLVSFV